MKTTNITKKIAAIFAAAIMATTISVSASASDVRVKGTFDDAASEQTITGIPRGGKVTAEDPSGGRVTAEIPRGGRVTACDPCGGKITAGIPRGGKLTIRVMGEETNPELEGSVENPTFGVRV